MHAEEQGALKARASRAVAIRWIDSIRRFSRWSTVGLALLPAVVLAAAGTVTYTYDELGRLKTATYTGGTTTSYSLDPAGNRKTVTDTVPAGTVQFSASTATIAENLGPLTLTVTRASGTGGAGSVTCSTTAGTATAGSDFTTTSTVLNWANGESASKSCVIPIINNSTAESNETFTVGLSAASGVTIGTPSSVTVTITDDEETTPPTAPTGLTATPISSTQVNLSWTAATDTGSGVAGYRVERCTGSTCTTFAEIGTPTGTTYSDTTTAGTTTYRYRVRAIDAAGNLGPYSSIVNATTPDTIAPTTPGTLSGTAASSTQVNLSWGVSTDSGGSGLAGYKVERCEGASCTTFAQITTPTTTSYSDTTVIPSRTYRYRVRAYDNSGNNSSYTNIVNVTPPDGYLQLTDSAGAVLAAHTALYETTNTCLSNFPGAGYTCTWRLLKKYGNLAAVWSVLAFSGGPGGFGCPTGTTAITTTGYQRPSTTSCQINALGSVYGQ